MDKDEILKLSIESDAHFRRQMAVHASDVDALRAGLLSAAGRFEDIADIIAEKRDYDPVPFMRESAKRYRILASLK